MLLSKKYFPKRISSGDKLLFFPEGTSTDGMRILPFKSTLFAAFFEEGLPEISWIQPVTLNYIAPETKRADWYGWWADMGFFPPVIDFLALGQEIWKTDTPLNELQEYLLRISK